MRKDVEARILETREDLYNWAFGKTQNKDDAEEIVQETILRALQIADRCAQADSLRAYVFVIARHVLVDRIRAQQPMQPLTVEPAAPEPVPATDDDDARRRMQWAIIEQASRELGKVGPRYLLMARLRYAEGLPVKAVAERVGLTVGGVKSALHKLRQAAKRLAAKPGSDV